MTVPHDEHEMPPADEPGNGRTAASSSQSRRNAIRDGCRSRTEFPDDMQALIDSRLAELTAEEKPKTAVERTLPGEIARSGVQADSARKTFKARRADSIITLRESEDDIQGWSGGIETGDHAPARVFINRINARPASVAVVQPRTAPGAG